MCNALFIDHLTRHVRFIWCLVMFIFVPPSTPPPHFTHTPFAYSLGLWFYFPDSFFCLNISNLLLNPSLSLYFYIYIALLFFPFFSFKLDKFWKCPGYHLLIRKDCYIRGRFFQPLYQHSSFTIHILYISICVCI